MPASNAQIPGHWGNNPEAVKARQEAFLEALEFHGTIKHACQVVRINRTTVASWRRQDVNGFASRLADAQEDFAEEIEYTVYQRVKEPDCPPVLQIFVLNGLKPDKYRPQTTVTDDTAKDIMVELRKKFRGIKFDETPTAEEISVHQQAEDILKSKRS